MREEYVYLLVFKLESWTGMSSAGESAAGGSLQKVYEPKDSAIKWTKGQCNKQQNAIYNKNPNY